MIRWKNSLGRRDRTRKPLALSLRGDSATTFMESKNFGLMLALGIGGLFLDAACEPAPIPKLSCGPDETYGYRRCWLRADVRLNTVGLLPERKKVAAFAGDEARFEVRRVSDDQRVFEGKASAPVDWPETGEKLRMADFSDLREPGEYYVSVVGTSQRSAAFSIGSERLVEAASVSVLAMYGQRCGEAVHLEHEGDTFSHDECHMAEARLDHAKYPASSAEGAAGAAGASSTPATAPAPKSLDDRGGWHDAGDYGKYTVNGAFALAYYLKAYEEFPETAGRLEVAIPERDNDVPDLLDESRVELEWLLKVQFPNGAFAHKVTGLNFEANIMPEADLQTRYFTEAGSAATGDAAAVLALGARLYRELDPEFSARCLDAARRGAAFLDEHPELIRPDLSKFATGAYLAGDGDADERAWALIELYETTGELEYLKKFEDFLKKPADRVPAGGPSPLRLHPFIDWYGANNLALITYVRSASEERDPDLLAQVQDSLLLVADSIVTEAETDPYGRGSRVYSWGGNGGVVRMSHLLAAAYTVEPKEEYLDTIQAQVDHVFGRNPFSRSFVTGVGHYPPLYPHHRPSTGDDVGLPWPGLLIGGPHGDGNVPGHALPAMNWADALNDYWHNEIAINWNTALTYALIALLGTSESELGPSGQADAEE